MTILLLDGFTLEKTENSFDERPASSPPTDDKGRYPESNTLPLALIDQEGRLGGKAFRTVINLNFNAITTASIGGNYQTGFGFRVQSMATTANDILVAVRNESNQITLDLSISKDVNETGFRLRLKRHAQLSVNDIIIGTSEILDFNDWFYVEIFAELTTTSTAAIFKIGGDKVVDAPDVTGDMAPGYHETRFRLRPVAWGASSVDMDDLYISDGAEGFFGPDIQIVGVVPNSGGSVNDFTPTPPTSLHHLHVDDAATGAVDYDNTYLEGVIVGEKELFGLKKLANAQGKVHAVRVAMDAKATVQAGPILPIIVTGSENPLTEQIVVDTGYNHYGEIRQLDPDTGKAWNVDVISTLKIGLEIPSGTLGGTLGMDLLEADGIGIGCVELTTSDELPLMLPVQPNPDGLVDGVVSQKLPITTPISGPGFIDLKVL